MKLVDKYMTALWRFHPYRRRTLNERKKSGLCIADIGHAFLCDLETEVRFVFHDEDKGVIHIFEVPIQFGMLCL